MANLTEMQKSTMTYNIFKNSGGGEFERVKKQFGIKKCQHKGIHNSPCIEKKPHHHLKWFMQRIGKRVYREKYSTIILDKMHAKYMFLVQNELNIEFTDASKNDESPA